MRKSNKSTKSNREPLLDINEFEEAAGAILDLTKDQTLIMLQEANQKSAEIVQKAKESSPILEKASLEKIEEEIKIEKEKLILTIKEKLKFIKTIPEEKIRQAVDYILEKILP